MEELIEKKLIESAKEIIAKKKLNLADVTLLTYLLNRIDIKKQEKKTEEQIQKSNKALREQMKNIFEGVM